MKATLFLLALLMVPSLSRAQETKPKFVAKASSKATLLLYAGKGNLKHEELYSIATKMTPGLSTEIIIREPSKVATKTLVHKANTPITEEKIQELAHKLKEPNTKILIVKGTGYDYKKDWITTGYRQAEEVYTYDTSEDLKRILRASEKSEHMFIESIYVVEDRTEKTITVKNGVRSANLEALKKLSKRGKIVNVVRRGSGKILAVAPFVITGLGLLNSASGNSDRSASRINGERIVVHKDSSQGFEVSKNAGKAGKQ